MQSKAATKRLAESDQSSSNDDDEDEGSDYTYDYEEVTVPKPSKPKKTSKACHDCQLKFSALEQTVKNFAQDCKNQAKDSRIKSLEKQLETKSDMVEMLLGYKDMYLSKTLFIEINML